MNYSDFTKNVVGKILDEMAGSKSKRIKTKTLLKIAKMERRSEEAMAQLSQALFEAGISVSPGLLKAGEDWQTGLDDWLYFESIAEIKNEPPPPQHTPDARWKDDPWFSEIQSKELRTEREVETKFVIHLLNRLGYTEDDRYDDMPIHVSLGSKPTLARIDFALYNKSNQRIANQVILTVEAKKEERLSKEIELRNAFNQAKCYAVWTGCRFCLVTDSKDIVLYKIGLSNVESECELLRISRANLANDFPKLYSLCSKESLSEYYLKVDEHSEDMAKAG